MTKKFILSYIILCLNLFALSAQLYRHPVDIPPALSGGFGELRNNHFHSGIDYKTQQVVNKPILSIADGYVSRISVAAGGYGLALYIDHPATGHTSVYAHLNSFAPAIERYVKQHQYDKETYVITLYPKPHELPVKRGEQIALSGNTGGSGGPHLHFEIRDTKSEEPMDVLDFVPRIPDTTKPELRGIAFYPIEGRGSVNNSSNPTRLSISRNKSGTPQPLSKVITAWGRIGIGVKAYDKTNGQHNILGVRHIKLFVDNVCVFESNINRFAFNQTRMLNSFIDFEDWRLRNSFFMKSFIENGNYLPFYTSINKGYIDINQERTYKMRYELSDTYGNTTVYNFDVVGKKQPLAHLPQCDNFMPWSFPNLFMNHDFSLNIPAGNLYTDVCFRYRKEMGYSTLFSDIHQVHRAPVPLHNHATIWIKLNRELPSAVKQQQLGIVRVLNNGKTSWVGGTYQNGGVQTTIRELGHRYAIGIDQESPKITPLEPASWVRGKRIRIRLSDNMSGIKSFRGEINGKFVLFTHDIKSPVYTYIFDDTRQTKGSAQKLVFTATDHAGNTSQYEYSFEY